VVARQQDKRAEGAEAGLYGVDGLVCDDRRLSGADDPVNGTVRGDSLTFYTTDDRVVVEGKVSSRAVTHTHVSTMQTLSTEEIGNRIAAARCQRISLRVNRARWWGC